MRDPVLCADGHSYQRENIAAWFATGRHTSPLTGVHLEDTSLTSNHALRNTIEEWLQQHFQVTSLSDITIGRLIARGSFKSVHEGTLRGRPIAIAKMGPGTVETEAATLVKLGRHPGLITYHGICTDGGQNLLLTELAEGGSLDTFLEEHEEEMTLEHQLIILQQVCSAMQTLAHAGLVHRDLAARNVLVTAFDAAKPAITKVKVTDFGLAVSRHYQTHSTVAGDEVPFRWMPPEALRRRRFSEKSDVWSFGVFAWELLSGGDIPYAFIMSNEEVAQRVVDGERLPRPRQCPDDLWTLVTRCWAASATDRPTFQELTSEVAGVVSSWRTTEQMKKLQIQLEEERARGQAAEQKFEEERTRREAAEGVAGEESPRLQGAANSQETTKVMLVVEVCQCSPEVAARALELVGSVQGAINLVFEGDAIPVLHRRPSFGSMSVEEHRAAAAKASAEAKEERRITAAAKAEAAQHLAAAEVAEAQRATAAAAAPPAAPPTAQSATEVAQLKRQLAAAQKALDAERAAKQEALDAAQEALVSGNPGTYSLSDEIDGLKRIVSSTAALGGIAATGSTSWWASQNVTLEAAATNGVRVISFDDIQKALNKVRVAGGTPTAIVTSLGVQREIYALFQTQGVYQENVQTPDYSAGFRTLTYAGLPIVADIDAPYGTMYILDESSLKVFSDQDFHFLDSDGQTLRQAGDKDAFEAVMVRYMNMGAVRRNNQAVISNIAVDGAGGFDKGF